MKMILAGAQPDYLPYIGFFHKMSNCDSYMIVDHVQFSKKAFQNRNQIEGKNGIILLTVPALTKNKFDQPIKVVLRNFQLFLLHVSLKFSIFHHYSQRLSIRSIKCKTAISLLKFSNE